LKLHGRIRGVSAALALAGLLLACGLLAQEARADKQCAAQCYAQEKACMRATKGGSSCDAVLTRCLQGCLRR
jgi:hypothetical protein